MSKIEDYNQYHNISFWDIKNPNAENNRVLANVTFRCISTHVNVTLRTLQLYDILGQEITINSPISGYNFGLTESSYANYAGIKVKAGIMTSPDRSRER